MSDQVSMLGIPNKPSKHWDMRKQVADFLKVILKLFLSVLRIQIHSQHFSYLYPNNKSESINSDSKHQQQKLFATKQVKNV